MTNTKITIMPDDRLPLGKSQVYISSAQIVPVPTAKGGYFDAVQLEVHFLLKSFNMTVKKFVNIPIFWSGESTFVKMLRSFDNMKAVGEDTDLGDLAHKLAEATVVENTKNGRVYRNVSEIVPISTKPHPLLKKLYDTNEEAYQMSINIFDDDIEVNGDKKDTSEESCAIELIDNDQHARNKDSKEDVNTKIPPSTLPPNIPGIKRRKPVSPQSRSAPVKSQLFDDDNEDLGNF